MSENIPIIVGLLVIFFIWLAGLSYFLYKTISHYNRLTKETHSKNLQSILEILIKNVQGLRSQVKTIDGRLVDVEKEIKLHFQKVGLLRFNPFADTGGEQSFIIALLDYTNSGIVLTSLQGRTGVRWYAKKVKNGKGIKYDLSKEEEEAVKKAKPL